MKLAALLILIAGCATLGPPRAPIVQVTAMTDFVHCMFGPGKYCEMWCHDREGCWEVESPFWGDDLWLWTVDYPDLVPLYCHWSCNTACDTSYAQYQQCRVWDVDDDRKGDGDIDLEDFAVLQRGIVMQVEPRARYPPG